MQIKFTLTCFTLLAPGSSSQVTVRSPQSYWSWYFKLYKRAHSTQKNMYMYCTCRIRMYLSTKLIISYCFIDNRQNHPI